MSAPRSTTTPLLYSSSKFSDVRITRPDGRIDTLHIDAAAGGGWSYDATDVSGIYSVRTSDNSEPLQLAVNVDTQESDLSRLDLRQLPEKVHVIESPQASAEAGTNAIETRTGWQQPLLAGGAGAAACRIAAGVATRSGTVSEHRRAEMPGKMP